MLCEKCKKRQAVVHMQQIINGQITELRLCPECAGQYDSPLSFEQFLHGLLEVFGGMPETVSPQKPESKFRCPVCGLSYEDFKRTGKVGCAECYQTFRREMEPILKNIQGGNRHEGKYPHKAGSGMLNRRKIDKLKVELSKAIEAEEYENAARLRDEIRELEAALS
ncbi:MAG: UvrB/UvrC motif-containing protein [Clostridiales bacterium]|jgi:protein arginine kinase activator|nr:UvrB/UvrC motif-containing protein [Clostridiales bacterium]